MRTPSTRALLSAFDTPSSRALAGGVLALLTSSGAALAQPAGSVDLGNRAEVASYSNSLPVGMDSVVPVRWFRIRLPRIANPHRFMDITTSGSTNTVDTEIALYSAAGVRLAQDDDDGAVNYSALSFGITDPGAATRTVPPAAAGQSAGAAPNGRDGTLSGDPGGPSGTVGEYYLAVTLFDVTFTDNFTVTRVNGPSPTAAATLTVRMHTPGGQVPPFVNGGDQEIALPNLSVPTDATVFGDVNSVTADLSAVGGVSSAALSNSFQNLWQGFTGISPLTQPGAYPLVYRASNTLGDVATSAKVLSVRPAGFSCLYAAFNEISSTPGSAVYTYDTRFGGIDGPWTGACSGFTPTGNDVWYRFNPVVNGSLTLSTCNADTGAVGGQPDTLLGVRGDCFDGGFSTCADDAGGACGFGTRLSNIPVVAGQEYNITVRAFGADIVGGRLAVTYTRACPADLGRQGGVAGQDGQLNNNDFIVFIDYFFASNPLADVGRQGGLAGSDGAWNNNDFIVFINLFFGGCQ